LAKLRVQHDDLTTAVNDLEKLISQLDKDIQSRFATSFKAINTQFGHFFHKLFGGGTGKLVYEARDNDEYGIEITATPPGKRTQQLAMLSGGERSLGAIALLAAIMAVNPSPFVVLDEVDAALDDANSQKFNQVLQDLTAKTQLIVITHNHETMQAAQQLIGITSDAQGVAMAVSAQLSPTGSI
jgi:chromosome segregation protein